MGAWGDEAWDSDDAADWFGAFFEGIDADARIDAAFEDIDDEFGRVRAAAYVLQVLGRVYVWPGDVERLGEHLDRAIETLENMQDPEHAMGEEMAEMWGEGAGVFDSIRAQIAELRQRRSEGNWETTN